MIFKLNVLPLVGNKTQRMPAKLKSNQVRRYSFGQHIVHKSVRVMVSKVLSKHIGTYSVGSYLLFR